MKQLLLFIVLFAAGMPAADAANRVWITEFTTTSPAARAPFAQLPANVHQPALTITNLTAVSSAAFDPQTRYIRVLCEVQCSIRVGAGAAWSDMALPAGRPEYFGVSPGKTISVIANP